MRKKLKILIITNLYPPQELGGYGRCIADFAWGLIQRGHNLKVLTANASYLGTEEKKGPSGEDITREIKLLGSYEGGLKLISDNLIRNQIIKSNIDLLNTIISNEKFDGILIGNLDLIGIEVLQFVVSLRLPVIHHIGFITPPLKKVDMPVGENYMLIAASKAVRDSIASHQLPIKKDSVVYPGARIEKFGYSITNRKLPEPLSGYIANEPGSEANPLKIAFAGLLMASKGVHTIIEATAYLNSRGIKAQVNLAGAEFQDGYWNQMKQYAKNKGICDQISWFGQLNREQLAKFMCIHHIGIFPSIYPEAFGIVAAEYMASGLVTVTSGVGGSDELIEHGKTGMKFKAGNSEALGEVLEYLARNPKVMIEISQNGKEKVQDYFSVEKSSEELERFFLDLIK